MESNNSNTDTRNEAIEWWHTQNRYDKALYFITFKEKHFTPANDEMQLTGREIELIYKFENPQPKESTHITWWKGLNEEEQTKLCQKHFQGIPVESLMERSIG